MSASRKLYVELATTIARHVDIAGADQIDAIRTLVHDLAVDLKVDNRNFDRDRFLAACGLS